MRLLLDFINRHDANELTVLAFYLTVGGTSVGWVIDAVMRDRGFGVVGNGMLVLLGAVIGAIVAQMYAPVMSLSETNRILIYSASTSALVLVICAFLKGRLSLN